MSKAWGKIVVGALVEDTVDWMKEKEFFTKLKSLTARGEAAANDDDDDDEENEVAPVDPKKALWEVFEEITEAESAALKQTARKMRLFCKGNRKS